MWKSQTAEKVRRFAIQHTKKINELSMVERWVTTQQRKLFHLSMEKTSDNVINSSYNQQPQIISYYTIAVWVITNIHFLSLLISFTQLISFMASSAMRARWRSTLGTMWPSNIVTDSMSQSNLKLTVLIQQCARRELRDFICSMVFKHLLREAVQNSNLILW